MSDTPRKFQGLVAHPLSAVAGRHYYGLKCSACSGQIAILSDATGGAAPVKIKGAGEIEVVCPFCQSAAGYQLTAMEAFRQL
jgi:hypothetical protein